MTQVCVFWGVLRARAKHSSRAQALPGLQGSLETPKATLWKGLPILKACCSLQKVLEMHFGEFILEPMRVSVAQTFPGVGIY